MPTIKGVLLATGNPGKLLEMQKFLAPLPVTSVKELGIAKDVVEDGETLEANAAKKARAYAAEAAQRNLAVLADDTGLEIDALGGEPGIKVRRWIGREMTDDEIIDHALSRMRDVPEGQRGAQFRTVLALLADPSKPEAVEHVDGRLRGRILTQPIEGRWAGKPFQCILHVDEWGMCLGPASDLSAEEKRKRGWLSHRERALDALRSRLSELTQQPSSSPLRKRPRTVSKNSAFVFIKPHAVTDATKKLVRSVLASKSIAVAEEGFIPAEKIDSDRLIDQHYYAIASKAVLLEPREIPVPADKFQAAFGESWETVLSEGRALNAKQACEYFGFSDTEMDDAWQLAKKQKKMIKFGGGFYGALIHKEGKQPRYSFNGFYMSMRQQYTEPGTGIHWLLCEWDPDALSWADFRAKVLGATDPAAAEPGSLRHRILTEWESLGLQSKPWVGANGVHGSASPFEALAERRNWLRRGGELRDDAFAAQLLTAGISEDVIKRWSSDAQVLLPGGGRGSVFDQFEDLDAAPCVAKAAELAVLQRTN